MRIKEITDYRDIDQKRGVVLVLGYFDGLHLGHKALFDEARAQAADRDLEIAVLTFKESPQLVFSKYHSDLMRHVTYPERRYAQFEAYGVDHLYLIDFTSRFAKLTSQDFIDHYLSALCAEVVIVGFDYRFGSDGADSKALEEQFSGPVIVIPERQHDGQKISSTRIRDLLGQGQVAKVNELLDYPFSTRGIVVHGDARGRTIGFPTANLAPIDRTHLPAEGVYVTEVQIAGKWYRSMTSVGKNITFGGEEERLEVNIFDFSGDLYGERLEVFWLDKIREMIKFDGVTSLVTQLQADEQAARNWCIKS